MQGTLRLRSYPILLSVKLHQNSTSRNSTVKTDLRIQVKEAKCGWI
jgi:hypothetical protein